MKYTNINYKVVYLHLYWIFDILFKALQLSEHHKRHFSSNSWGSSATKMSFLFLFLLTIYVSYIKIHNSL